MKPFLLLSLALVLVANGRAGAQEGRESVIRTESGQFVVHVAAAAAHQLLLPRLINTASGEAFLLSDHRGAEVLKEQPIHLNGPLVAFACERVKHAFLTALDLRDDWSGQIHLFLEPEAPGGRVSMDSLATARGWIFRLTIPSEMSELDLDRMILHALLLERGNRNPGTMANNIPKWLTEGLVRCLRAAAPDALSVQNQTRTEFRRTAKGPLTTSIALRPAADAEARRILDGRQPLTFEEMCWPETLEAEKAAVFTASAELFVYELLQARDGGACLSAMILRSRNYLNWQFTFLDAFQRHFQTLVEVEKWWSLRWTRVLGVDAAQLWVPAESWEKLEFCLRVTLEVRTEGASVRTRRVMTIQAAIRELPVPAQRMALETALYQLKLVEPRVPPRLQALAREYQNVIQDYLLDTTLAGRNVIERHSAPVNLNVSKETAQGKLNLLDRKKVKLKAEMQPPGERASISP